MRVPVHHGGVRKASWSGWPGPRHGERRVCVWCPRDHLDDGAGRMEDILEELLQHRDPEALQQCLRKVRALLTALVLTGGDRPMGPFSEGLSAPIYEMGVALGVLFRPTALQP